LGTESVYLYNRYKEFQIDFLTNPERTKHIEKHIEKDPFLIFLFSLAIFIISIFNKNFPGLIFAVFLLLLGFLYSEIFKKLTQKIIGFKSFFVSLMWSLLVLFLTVYYSVPINLAIFLFFVFVFLRFFVSVSFFDIKDIKTDKQEGLKTLAVVLTQQKLLQLLGLINILAILPLIIGVYLRVLPISSLMLFLTVPYTFFYFKQLENKKINPSFLYNVIVDGEFIFWPFFILLGNFILTKL
jgi:4-hydroxybenzoate polyprenyltransferase